jgi:hypothetical protein
MIAETIKYTDFNGTEREEVFHFNLTEEEATTIELSAEGNSFQDMVAKIAAEQDGKKIIEAFKLIIEASYGIKSVDGRRFEKSDVILANFKSTAAYSKLFMRLATDTDFAVAFTRGLVSFSSKQGEQAAADAITARQRSEAQMQGHQKKAEPIPETVHVSTTAQPVLADIGEKEAAPSPAEQHLPTNATFEEYQAWKASQGFTS